MDEEQLTSSSPERAFQSLYRRYRPQRFSELRGQEHVVLALRNAVREEHVAHAYLFSGPRGTGKTSAARILAKALNCTALEDGEPCGKCEACTSIANGTSFDVHELDAASNNGVDAMRDLVARAALATPGSWKVYIVDEVHMLSTAASNALLKTLEEPPSHVVFVLATTDPQKVLPTIRSRTQHFEFHLIGEDVLRGLLEEISLTAQLDLPEGGIASALRRAKGSARDALSFLDQVAAAGVLDGNDDTLPLLITALAATDTNQLLAALDSALRQGHDAQQLAVELIDALRAGFLSLVGPENAGASLLDDSELESIRSMGTARCVRTIELLGKAVVEMRDSADPRVTFEVALVRAGHPEMEDSFEALIERIERLEHRLLSIESGESQRASGQTSEPAEQLASPAPPPPAASQEHTPQATAPEVPDRQAPPVKASSEAGGQRAVDDEAPSPEPVRERSNERRPALGAYRRSEPAATALSAQAPIEAEAPEGGDRTPTAPIVDAIREPPAPPTARPFPSRDELVMAWGDHLLMRLRPKAKAIFLVSRFTGTENGFALLALPNEAHRRVAEPLSSEVAETLSAHFGTPIKVRLVIDEPSAPFEQDDNKESSVLGEAVSTNPSAPRSIGRDEVEGEEIAELDEDDAHANTKSMSGQEGLGLAWAEDRLLQAFPGAEEL